MAYKMKIPDSWLKMSPKTANIGYLYNLDSAVGSRSRKLFSAWTVCHSVDRIGVIAEISCSRLLEVTANEPIDRPE